jgi:hypothetical protein
MPISTFSAIVLTVVVCSNGSYVSDGGICPDGTPPHTYQMHILNGDGDCQMTVDGADDCGAHTVSLAEVFKDGKVVATIRADTIPPAVVKFFWQSISGYSSFSCRDGKKPVACPEDAR